MSKTVLAWLYPFAGWLFCYALLAALDAMGGKPATVGEWALRFAIFLVGFFGSALFDARRRLKTERPNQ